MVIAYKCCHFTTMWKLWKDLRNRKKKIIAFIVTCLVVTSIYYTLNMRSWSWYNNSKKVVCVTPPSEMTALKKLSRDIHTILDELGLTHILIYGSLWGALRYNNPLPWDNDVDFGLFDDEVRHLDFNILKEKFNAHGMNISYRLWLGTYRVSSAHARGDLMVFRKAYFGNMVRTGVEPWVFFVNYYRYHTFPARLVERGGGLPKLSFAGMNMSVPREGVEIQKHFYPNDWWVEVKPRGC